MEYVHPSASFLLISIFDRVLSSCSLTISPSRQFSAIVVPFTVFGLSRPYCHSFRHVVTIVRASLVRRCIPHRTYSNPMLSQIPCQPSRVHILLGHSFLNSNCLHTLVKLVQRSWKLPWNDQRFRRCSLKLAPCPTTKPKRLPCSCSTTTIRCLCTPVCWKAISSPI